MRFALISACRYAKSDWSACENGVKTKTLTLSEGDSGDCEATKIISKQCAEPTKRTKTSSKRGRKKTPTPTNDNA